MAGILEVIVKAQDQASGVLRNIENQGTSSGKLLEQTWVKVTAACTAAGLAIEGIARKQQTNNLEISKAASALGMTEKAYRDLALSARGTGDSIDEVIQVMEAGRKSGIDSGDALKKYSQFWDMVGDATGESTVELAKSGVTLRAVGVEVGHESEALDAFGLIMNNSQGSVTDFMSEVGKLGPKMHEMDLSVNDAAVTLVAMENELGLTSRTALAQFRTATEEASKSTGTAAEKQQIFYDALGLTQGQIDKYREKLNGAGQAIEDAAAKQEELLTPLQKLQEWAGSLGVTFGDVGAKLADFTPVLIGVGPAMKIAQDAAGLLSGTGGLGGIGSVVGSILPMIGPQAPFIAAIVGIGAAIAGVAYLWSINWGDIQGKTDIAVQWLGDRFKALTDGLGKAWEAIQPALAKVGEVFQAVFGKIGELIDKIFGGGGKFDIIGAVIDTLALIWDKTWEGIGAAIIVAADLIVPIIETLGNAIIWIVDRIIEFGNSTGAFEIIGQAFDVLGTVVSIVSKLIGKELQAMADAIGVVFGWIGDAIDTLVGWFNAFMNNPVIKAIATAVGGAFGAIGDAVNNTLTGVNRDLDAYDAALGETVATTDTHTKSISGSLRSLKPATEDVSAYGKTMSTDWKTQMGIMADGTRLSVDQTLKELQRLAVQGGVNPAQSGAYASMIAAGVKDVAGNLPSSPNFKGYSQAQISAYTASQAPAAAAPAPSTTTPAATTGGGGGGAAAPSGKSVVSVTGLGQGATKTLYSDKTYDIRTGTGAVTTYNAQGVATAGAEYTAPATGGGGSTPAAPGPGGGYSEGLDILNGTKPGYQFAGFDGGGGILYWGNGELVTISTETNQILGRKKTTAGEKISVMSQPTGGSWSTFSVPATTGGETLPAGISSSGSGSNEVLSATVSGGALGGKVQWFAKTNTLQVNSDNGMTWKMTGLDRANFIAGWKSYDIQEYVHYMNKILPVVGTDWLNQLGEAPGDRGFRLTQTVPGGPTDNYLEGATAKAPSGHPSVAGYYAGYGLGFLLDSEGKVTAISGNVPTVSAAGLIGQIQSNAGQSPQGWMKEYYSDVKGLAEGGNITKKGVVLVGERGPELLNLPKGAAVTPLTPGQKVGNKKELHIHFDGLVIMDQISMRKAARMIQDALTLEQTRRGINT